MVYFKYYKDVVAYAKAHPETPVIRFSQAKQMYYASCF